MLEVTQRDLAKRVLAHLDRGTTDCADREQYHEVGAYRDPDRYQREIDRVFRRFPTIVGHASQLKDPGDFVTDRLYGVPVLLMRTRSGSVRGHVNACRHRGTKLLSERSGRGLLEFSCPYHAWRYDTEGALRYVPDQKRSFPGLDLATRGLLPIDTHVRHGFLWAGLSDPGPDGAGDRDEVAAFLGPADEELGTYGLDGYVFYRDEVLSGNFNWKLGVEAFLEAYHFQTLHPTMRNYILVPEVALVDRFGMHSRFVAPKRSVKDLKETDEADLLIRPNATILYLIFPSTLVFVEKRHVSVMEIRPVAPDRSDVKIIHVVQDDSLTLRPYWEQNIEVFMRAVREDLAVCELVQEGCGGTGIAGCARQMDVVFGRNEIGLHTFRETLEALVLQ